MEPHQPVPAEQRSYIHWRSLERGDDHLPAPVLFFEEDPPARLLESGKYVCFDDFNNVMRATGVRAENMANIFHTLVLFFAEGDPRLHEQATKHLRYNPGNQASWNRFARTYQYYILVDLLPDYAHHKVTAENKIKGIGTVGRTVMRFVLYDEDTELELPTN